jgi:putative membrane protein
MKRMGLFLTSAALVVATACNGDGRRDLPAYRDVDSVPAGTSGVEDIKAPTDADKRFVDEIGAAGMAEVQLGRLAKTQAADPDVKRFADMMIRDHSKANEELKTAATAHGMPLPQVLDAKHRDLVERLSGLHGPDFDREYMKAMVQGHQDVSDRLEQRVDKDNWAAWKSKFMQLTSDKNPTHDERPDVRPERSDNPATAALNAWSAKALPTVYGHLHRAKALKDKVETRSTR